MQGVTAQPPCSCPSQPAYGVEEGKGHLRVKSSLQVAQEPKASVCVGTQAPAGTTCGGSHLATHGARRPKPLGS